MGLEAHDFESAGGKLPFYPHFSIPFPFTWALATQSKRANKVTADFELMMQQGYDYYVIPHIPVPSPPNWGKEAIKLALIIAGSGSKLQMAVLSVTSGGGPLACCLASMFSANVNCSDPIDFPTGFVVNFSSVVTSPTAMDYGLAVLSYGLDSAISYALGWGLGEILDRNKFEDILTLVLKHAWRRAPDAVADDSPLKWGLDFPGKITTAIKSAVDGKGGAK